MSAAMPKIKVLMVCLGNICRSPTAEGVLRKLLIEQKLEHLVEVDSAGTSGWHEGEPPDHRSITAAATRGYDLACQRSRKVTQEDFEEQHYILAMDEQNLRDLQRICPPQYRAKLSLLLEYGDTQRRAVPDPYELPLSAFDTVIELCEQACRGFLQHLMETHELAALRDLS